MGGFCIGCAVALFIILNVKKLFPGLIEREEAKEILALHENL